MKDIRRKLMIFFVVFVMGVVASRANAKLVAYWELDEASGSAVADSSGNDNDVMLHGNPTRVTGRVGGALEFDGLNDFVDVDSKILEGSFSFALWLRYDRITKYSSASIMCNDAWDTGSVHVNLRYPGMLNVYMRSELDVKGITSNIVLNHERWYHVVVTYDTSTDIAKIYINGLLDIEKTSFSPSMPWIGPMNIGAWKNSKKHFKGTMDDVCIFDHALNDYEVKQLYTRCGKWFVPLASLRLVGEVQKARSIAENQGPQEAIVFLEKKIAEYKQWKEKNQNDIGLHHKLLLSELHFLLARAKEAANAPIQDVIAAYKQSVLQLVYQPHYVPALLWMFENMSDSNYADAVKKSVCNSNSTPDDLAYIAKDFESSKNWAAFKIFLDVMLSEVNDATSYAKGLEEDGVWANKFLEYCQNRPELTQYIFHRHEKIARKYIAQKNFKKAAEIYDDIIRQCSPNQLTAVYELKLYECLFNDGQYDTIIQELGGFIKNNKVTHKALMSKAIMLKGRAYVRLGDIDRAMDELSTLTIEYPEAKQAHEANFFIGYCYMLQSKFDKATEVFDLVVKDYPESSYVDKACSYLNRIKKMTE